MKSTSTSYLSSQYSINKLFAITVFFLFSVLYFSACGDDEMVPENNDPMEEEGECDGINISYMDDIVPIINESCAISNCHVSGFPSGDFTSYDGLKAKADGGQLVSRVVLQQNMPPNNSSGPTSLSDDQIMAFKCWLEAGAPDN